MFGLLQVENINFIPSDLLGYYLYHMHYIETFIVLAGVSHNY